MEAHDLSFEKIQEGVVLTHEYAILPETHQALTEVFGDVSPIHVDEAYAKASGFKGRVMHGTILNGFVSHFVGMVLPGRRAMLLSVDLRYLQPCYLGDTLTLAATVRQKVESNRALLLEVVFKREASGETVANGRCMVKVRDE